MKINLSPQVRTGSLDAVRVGNVLVINGEVFDFTQMQPGDTLPRSAIQSEWFAGPVDNIGGELELTLLLPLPLNYSQAQAYPTPVVLMADGPVPLPAPLPVTEVVVSQESAEELAQPGGLEE